MCSVGGEIFDVDIRELDADAKFYKCNDCSNEFKGIGTRIVCPSCHSDNVKKLFKEE